ncbi:hypothetical protein MNBD_ALPHA01-2456 [hydrothermal vent metagenome]|uniref:Uncharacterized protein n=1 Tax=hydrothermal vent metagenome TaxID=652676 RepID=A0A3B0S3Y6_9ZZZZ
MFLETISNREKTIWANVLLDVIIALYFFPKIFAMEGGIGANAGEMPSIIGVVIVMAIVGSLIIDWLLDVDKAEQKDERDYLFDARSYFAGFVAMFFLVSFLIGHLILNEITMKIFNFQYEALTSTQIVTYLLLLLMMAAFVKDVVKLFYYRRGY